MSDTRARGPPARSSRRAEKFEERRGLTERPIRARAGGGVARERRPIAKTPRAIGPHPESGSLPPCEYRGDDPCGKDATVHYGVSYLCEPHADAELARDEASDVELAIDVSKRYLWAVRQWDFYRLEHALDGALSEYQQAMERLRALEGAALERAAQDRGEEHGRAE